jgi:hypothetical protein
VVVTVMIEIAKWPQIISKQTAECYVFKYAHGLHSESAARAGGARVQSPKHEEILHKHCYSSFAQ